MYIVQLKYRTGERWSYAYVNNKMNMTTERRNAARFKRLDNAEDVARLLTKNTKYEGELNMLIKTGIDFILVIIALTCWILKEMEDLNND